MDVLELKQILSDIPDSAVIYTEADHGQSPEQSFSVYVNIEDFEDGELPFDGEDMDWQDIEDCEVSKIKAVLISY